MSSVNVIKSLDTRVERHRLAGQGGLRTGRDGADLRQGDSDRGAAGRGGRQLHHTLPTASGHRGEARLEAGCHYRFIYDKAQNLRNVKRC